MSLTLHKSMGVRRNFSRGEQCQQFAKLSQVAKDAAMQMNVRETLFRYYTTTPQKMPYVTVVTKNALLWQPSQVYSDHIQNRVSSNFESMVLIFTEVLPWSLNNQQIMTLFYLARRVSSVATRVSLVQIVAFFNIRFFRRVSNKLNASFTNT